MSSFSENPVPDSFWEIIDAAERDPEKLRARLEQLNRGGLGRFAWSFEQAAADLTVSPWRDHMNPDLVSASEDGVEDLCRWIVAQGRDFYEGIKANPATMPKFPGSPRDPSTGFLSVVHKLYFEQYGSAIPARIL